MPDASPEPFAFSLESEMWRINHERCGLFFGPAAAILQIAHPRIAQGVAVTTLDPPELVASGIVLPWMIAAWM